MNNPMMGTNNPMMGMNNPMMGMNNPMMGMNNNPMMGMNNPMMGMNNGMMGMNNPMMGMNNGMNDDTSSRIKSIIEPYEKKIKDLEEQIRQKDFEIAVLKEKLNKSVNNNIQPMNPFPQQMGMGFVPPMMNMSMNFNNENINKDKEIIKIYFRFDSNNSQNKTSITQRCFIDDEFGSVRKKVLKRLNIKGNADELEFIFNSKNVVPSLTVSELGITNDSNVFIVIPNLKNVEVSLKEEEYSNDKITVIFKTSQGINVTLYLDPNMTIGLAIQKYLIRVSKKELINNHEKKLVFLYNATSYTANDTISLKSLFKRNQGAITVNDVLNLIGA